ncbi:MAG: type II CAAX prenyl endopeptidase Rce1 family protein [Nitrososphaeraceae archaeon]
MVFVLSIPFWLADGLTQLPNAIPINLPISSLMAFNPLLAALIPTHARNKSAGTKELLKRAFDYKRIKEKRWYIPIIFLMPAMMFLAYWLMILMRLPLPEPHIPLLLVLTLFPVFFIFAMGEEVGWLGYAIDPMQALWAALKASIMLGSMWALRHIWGYFQTGNGPAWVMWQSLGSVPLRILIVWLYNNTGKSILVGIIFHAMINVSEFSFPNYGSHYDPFISCIIFSSVAAIVVFLWGPRAFTQPMFA